VILAFVSRKGGVGKTTSVVNLAGAFARLGARVLVVDLDAQASASRALGVPREALAPSSFDVLFRRAPLLESVRPTAVERLDLLTASVDLQDAELELQNLRGRDERLDGLLRPHAAAWDWVLIDAPPGLGGLTRNALLAADAWVAPTPPHFLAFEGIDVLLEAAERLYLRCGRRGVLAGILLTMVDNRTGSARVHAAELRLKFGLQVCDTEIPVNVRLAESPAAGQTIFERDGRASGAHAYRLLAVELLQRLHPGAPLPPPPPPEPRRPARPPRATEPKSVERGAEAKLEPAPEDSDEILN
jgi:chromosome partitioning protein